MGPGSRLAPRPSTRAGMVFVLVLVGLITLASGGTLAWQRFLAPPSVAGSGVATLDGLTTEVRAAGWVDFDMGHVMDGEGGFMMPDQMMPGAPSGEQVRLGVTLTLRNTDSHAHGFNLVDEFWLIGGGVSDSRPLSADTVGGLARLGPGAAVDGVLYFDVVLASESDPLYLEWRRGGDAVRIPVPPTDEPPGHQHG